MKTLFWICGAILAAFGGALLFRGAGANNKLIVHEWGTFTSLEDERGLAIAGINVDDEPTPVFVHRIWEFDPGEMGSKGIPAIHPDVTVRLETPVLYVHAPAGFTGPLDVRVSYPGGWLTEFYPDAESVAPGLDAKDGHAGHITPETVGTLHWAGLQIGGEAQGPETKERVWTSPRKVAADAIRTPKGESEKFLFYRGVGCQTPVLKIARNGDTNHVVADDESVHEVPQEGMPAMPFCLADIRPDGNVAFQWVNPTQGSRAFDAKDYSEGNMSGLRASLEERLIGAGLYKDEAEALLNTWEVSYFKSPGLRAFCVVPQATVDKMLPLTITPAAEIKRVMIGRVELVTPQEREEMARLDGTDESWTESQKLFGELGRFAVAMVLDQERQRPTGELESFIKRMGVRYYTP